MRLLTDSSLARGTTFAQQYPKPAAELRRLTDDALAGRLADLLAQRRKLLDARADRLLKGQAETPEQTAELAAVENRIDLLRFEQALRRYEAQPWRGRRPTGAASRAGRLFRPPSRPGCWSRCRSATSGWTDSGTEWPVFAPLTVDGVDLLAVPL